MTLEQRAALADEPMTPQPDHTDGEPESRYPSLLRLDWLRGSEGFARRRVGVRYGAVVVLVGVATAMTIAANLFAGGSLGYVGFVAAVALSAWLGGLRAGLVATVVSGILHASFFTSTPGVGWVGSPLELFRLVTFCLDGLLISAGTSALRRTSFREHRARSEAAILYAAERDARQASERSRRLLVKLQAVTADLARSVTPADVADAVLERGMVVLGATAGEVRLLAGDGAVPPIIGKRGDLWGSTQEQDRRAPQAVSLIAEAISTGRPVIVPLPGVQKQGEAPPAGSAASPPGASQPPAPAAPRGPAASKPFMPADAAELIASAAPPVPAEPTGDGGESDTLAAIPLAAANRTVGALLFRFSGRRELGSDDTTLLRMLGEQCAQALDRAAASEEQQRAVEALERGRAGLEFLAAASDALGAGTDLASALDTVACRATMGLADWCAVEVADGGRSLLAVSHTDPEHAEILRGLSSIAPHGLVRLFADCASDSSGGIERLGEGGWSARVGFREAVARLDALDAVGWIVVPIASGSVTGGIVLGAATPDRFDDRDLAVARDVARRIAGAVQQVGLYESVRRFKAAVDASLDAVFMFEPESLRLTYLNRAAAEQVAADEFDVVGASMLDIQPDETEADLRRRLRPLLTGQQASITYSGTIVRHGGGETPVEAVLQHVNLPDGQGSLVLTAHDITERIEVQAQLARNAREARIRAAELAAILRAMREGVLVIDAAGSVTLASGAAEDILAGTPRDLPDVAARLHIDPDQLPDLGASSEPRVLGLPDGRWMEVSAHLAERRLGDPSRAPDSMVLVLRDVTAAREASQAREAFLSVLSHELRTPVTSIYGYAKVLQRPSRVDRPAELLQDIEAESERLYRMVEDLLALSHVEAGMGVDVEPLLVQHLVGPLVASEATRWPHVQFREELPAALPAVFGDRTHVEQVIRNLLSNAAKYSASSSSPSVTVTARPGQGEVEIRVLDRGIGIMPDEAERLFHLFYRSPSTSRVASGAGIGLFVCRGLVHAMGGRIWAAPRDGGGSEFGFSLPLCEVEPPAD